MSPERPALHPPQELLSALQATNQYALELGGVNLRELPAEQRHSHFNRAIGRTATVISSRMLENPRSSRERLDALQIRLLGSIGPFVDAKIELDTLNQQSNPHTYRSLDLKAQIIPFHHTIKDIISSYPQVTTANILSFVKSAQLSMGNARQAVAAEHFTSRSLVGMQHELGAEQIIRKIDGVSAVISRPEREYGETDKEHEKRCIDAEVHGIDLLVCYEDQWISVDVKGSRSAAADANHEKQRRGMDNKVALWSQLSLEDFNGKFYITDQLALRKAPAMERGLQSALTYPTNYGSA